MRSVLSLGVLTLSLCMALGAMAAEDDRIMGVYEGKFTGGDWSSRTIRAQVVGQSEKSWVANLFVAEAGGDEVRVEVRGRGEGKRHPANFDGEVDLGASLGGAYQLEGTIDKQEFSGALSGKDTATFKLERVMPEPPTRDQAPPEGAVALFGEGVDVGSVWRRDPEIWCMQPDRSMQVCSSNMITREEFGSGLYHIEFMTPYMPESRYQGRGNSGVYILGRYEVQVLDSFGTIPAWDLCGGIYKVAVPAADAVLPPLQWQTYDITFTAPEFDGDGHKTKNARITVVHNGVTVHDDLELPKATPGGVSGDEALQGVLMLQDHNDDVKYRNIWFKPAD